MISAKVVEDSVSEAGVRLTTLQLKYQRFIHAEFMTHRQLNRCASSSRAIPVIKMIEQVRSHPAKPLHWGLNQPGMQAESEAQGMIRRSAEGVWLEAAEAAADAAEKMRGLGIHKQVANRLLEPFQFMHVVVTATEWANFFELRDHPAAEPNIQILAREMRAVMSRSAPTLRPRTRLHEAAWHLPYVSIAERALYEGEPLTLALVSTARCARVSYIKHDGDLPVIEEDLELANKLVGSTPRHASPSEHQAYPMAIADEWSGNLRGWRQHRKYLEAA